MLFGAAHFDDGRFVLFFAAALTLLAVVEVSLMGRMTAHNLPVMLAIPLIVVVFLEHAALAARAADPRGAQTAWPWAQILIEYGVTLGVAVLAHTLSQGLTQAVGRQSNLRRVFLVTLGAGIVSGLGLAFDRGVAPGTIVLVLLGIAAVGACTVAFERERRRALILSTGVAVWLVVPLPALTQLWSRYGTGGLAALIVLSKVGDVAGYYVGRAIGKHHPFPRISPGKTTAGCVASLVAGAVIGLALAHFGALPEGSLGAVDGLIAGLVLNVAAQAGDLLESMLKRGAGVKDSSTWLGPAGGILDVIDSLLLTIPAALFSWPLLFGG